MTKLCECGCGEPAPIASRTDKARGVLAGQQLRFRHGHVSRVENSATVNWTEELVMRSVQVTDSGCWVWLKSISRTGYGKLQVDKKTWAAHRFVYTLLRGEIPEGMHLDHLCHTQARECPEGSSCPHRRCVNPDHLEPVTLAENLNRGAARRTECHNGHPYTEENVYHEPNGRRRCRTCALERDRRHRQRSTAA